MGTKNIFKIWLAVAVLAVTAYVIYNKIERKKYYSYINNLGFGAYWLDQMNTGELKTLYTYIHDYTQQGKTVTVGSSLDFALVAIGKKFPAILNYK
jgi:hypothetical protein